MISRRAVGFRLAMLGFAGLVTARSSYAAKSPAPFSAALEVRWGAGAGSDAFRDDLERALAPALATECFTHVTHVGAADDPKSSDLVYQVVLSGSVDETLFDDSIAATLQPGDPVKELRRVARFEVTVDATLTARVNGAVASRKHLVAHITRRPVYVGEDPQAMARGEAIGNIVRDLTRALGCGGTKLEKRVEDALKAVVDAPAAR
jgi:hypothetical protein